MMHNKGKSQSLQADPEVTQTIDSLDKDIKSYYNHILHLQEYRRRIEHTKRLESNFER